MKNFLFLSTLLLKFVIVLITIVTLVNGFYTPREVSYEEFCNTATKVYCNPRQFLTCQSHSCKCVQLQGVTYDPSRNGCMTLAGNKCSYIVKVTNKDEIEKGFKENMNCVANSKCDEKTGICICDDQFYKKPDGTCARSPQTNKCKNGLLLSDDGQCGISYLGNCDNLYKKCRKGFNCIKSMCLCSDKENFNLHKYDYNVNKCVTLVGGPCSNETNNTIDGSGGGCVTHASCVSTRKNAFTCKCDSGFVLNSDKGCDIAFGEECHPLISADCDKHAQLICINKKCVCQSDLQQAFDPTLRKCVSLVGSPCDFDILNEDNCARGSICVPTTNSTPYTGICECRNGFEFRNSSRTCHYEIQNDKSVELSTLIFGSGVLFIILFILLTIVVVRGCFWV